MTILKSKTVRIGLLGMYTSRNLGDVAIQYAIMNALRKRREEIEFVGLCQDPEDTVRAFGIPAVASTGFGSRLFPVYGAHPVQQHFACVWCAHDGVVKSVEAWLAPTLDAPKSRWL